MRPAWMLVPLLLVACSQSTHASGRAEATVHIRVAEGSVTVHASVSNTDAARERGLAGRTDLAPDGGMAFLFDHPVRASFWMKDTLIPLSIAFWGPRGRIVSIMDMPPCRSDPCPSFRPSVPYTGALEVNLGFFSRNGVEVGDRIDLSRR
jgi:uncharacterized membrane protein (UPF0127 family)